METRRGDDYGVGITNFFFKLVKIKQLKYLYAVP